MSRILLYRLRYILSDSLAMLLTILLFNILRYNVEGVTSSWGSLGAYLLSPRNLLVSGLVWLVWMALLLSPDTIINPSIRVGLTSCGLRSAPCLWVVLSLFYFGW